MPFTATPGTVYIVGAGPGAPDLLTMRAATVIAAAGLLLCADAEAAATLAGHDRTPAARAPLPADGGLALLAASAAAGQIAALLYSGDPAERADARALMRALRAANLPCELVPGVHGGAPAGGDAGPPEYAGDYPIVLTQLRGALAVVVGGGPVGARKIAGLVRAGAAVRLITPEATAELRAMAVAGQIEWLPRAYAAGDLAGARLAFAATSQRAVNATIAREAAALGMLCNVADAPEEGTFHLPAVHRTAEATIAVSTRGTSPGGAKRLRDRIALWLAGHP